MASLPFNINDHVHFKLREGGLLAIRKHYREMDIPPPVLRVGESYRWQLHVLMEMLGRECFVGMDPPIETTIRVESPIFAELLEAAEATLPHVAPNRREPLRAAIAKARGEQTDGD